MNSTPGGKLHITYHAYELTVLCMRLLRVQCTEYSVVLSPQPTLMINHDYDVYGVMCWSDHEAAIDTHSLTRSCIDVDVLTLYTS